MTDEPLMTNLSDADLNLMQLPAEQEVSTLARAPLAGVRSYYRSKIFTTNVAINPLVAAASALLTLAVRLREMPTYNDVNNLYHHLAHEIKSFENNAQKQGYRSETILVSRYVLCATLDELILNSAWGKSSAWEKHKLLAAFQRENWGGERFFIILDRLCEDPALHIDILELIYLCLSLGFEGKYQDQAQGKVQLAEIRENLYYCICKQRGEFNKELSNIVFTTPPPPVTTYTYQVPAWIVALMTGVLLLSIYMGFTYMLGASIAPLQQTIHNLHQEASVKLTEKP